MKTYEQTLKQIKVNAQHYSDPFEKHKHETAKLDVVSYVYEKEFIDVVNDYGDESWRYTAFEQLNCHSIIGAG
jgi:hypothetical protein